MLEPLFKEKERNSDTGVFLRVLQNCSKHVLLWNTPGGCFWICNRHNLVIARWPNNWSPLKRQIDLLREQIIDSKESHIKVKHNSKCHDKIHGFTISVLVLILPVFRQLLLWNGKIWSKYLLWNVRTKRADSKGQQESYFTSTLINFSIIISNQTKHYLPINRDNFPQIQYGFYGHALQFRYLLWLLVIERASTKNSRRLNGAGTWLLGASWWKFIEALLLYEIVHVICLFLTGTNIVNAQDSHEGWYLTSWIKYTDTK